MSIQFRSRIKPAIDYTVELNSYGTCCTPTGTAGPSSFYECFANGGQFIGEPYEPSNTNQCPNADTRLGCCCACSYVSDDEFHLLYPYPPPTPPGPYTLSGLEPNVSKCECDRRNGLWTDSGGSCSPLNNIEDIKTLCVRDPKTSLVDVRIPRACCHLGYDEDTGWPVGPVCTDVCSKNDCAALNTEDYPSVYSENSRCEIPMSTNGPIMNCSSSGILPLIATKTTLYSGFDIGSCYTLEDGTSSYDCSLTPESSCSGYWVKEQDADNAFCVTKHRPADPIKINGIEQVASMTQTDFDAIGLTMWDSFQEGYYLGIFEPTPNNQISSYVLGNIDFGPETKTRFYGNDIGNSSHKKWALFVREFHTKDTFLDPTDSDVYAETSLWDGYYNTYDIGTINSTLLQRIRSFRTKTFGGWYLPSIYELNYYALRLKEREYDKFRGLMLSSSMFSSKSLVQNTNKIKLINDTSFVFGQDMGSTISEVSTYRVGLIGKRSAVGYKMFRKIVIT